MDSSHKPILIVIAGPINTDNVAKKKFGDWNSTEAVINAAQYCEEWLEKSLSEKRSLIFETVFSSQGKVEFVRRALVAGYFVRVFFISTDNPTINSARIAKRVLIRKL